MVKLEMLLRFIENMDPGKIGSVKSPRSIYYGQQYVRHPPNTQLNPKYTKRTVKQSGASIMFWGCFAAAAGGSLLKIKGLA